MRKLSILAFATVAALSFAGASQATPLAAAGTVAATTNAAVATDNGGVTEVRWRRGYGWRHNYHPRRYGYYHRHHRGVRVIIR